MHHFGTKNSASAEIERQIETFEASIDQKTKEINENLEEQCKQRKYVFGYSC